MSDCPQDIRWSPRPRKDKLRRLYEQDALGIADEELLEEVGWCLHMRCRDILTLRRFYTRWRANAESVPWLSLPSEDEPRQET
jgi:hypothetical protein